MSIDAFPHPGGHEQPEPRQALQQVGAERRALAHRDDGVEGREPLGERLHAVDVIGEDGDVRVQLVPRPERPRDVLVVVEDGDRETAQERLAITCLMFVYSSTAYIDRSLP
jgi:hypothetical protein